MIVQISKDQTIETDNYTMVELLEISDAMQENIDSMQIAINKAKAERRQTGTYSDINWCRLVNSGVKIMRRNKQELMRAIGYKKNELAAKNREESRTENLRFERQFMVAAKLLLPDKTYQELIVMVQDRMRVS